MAKRQKAIYIAPQAPPVIIFIMADQKSAPPAQDINQEVVTPAPDVVNVPENVAIDRFGAHADAAVQPTGSEYEGNTSQLRVTTRFLSVTDASGEGLTAGVGMYQAPGDRRNAQPITDTKQPKDEQYA